MAELQTVLVDMDGVLADFDSQVERRLREADPAITPPDRTRDFYITKRLTDPHQIALAREIQASEGFFRSLEPIDYAIEGWRHIEEMGYRPQICSSPLRSNLWCTAEKLEWLDAHLGPAVADAAIITKNKSAYPGVALIDDRPAVNGAERASWKHVIFTQPYNQHLEAPYRIASWRDQTIGATLARCATRLF